MESDADSSIDSSSVSEDEGEIALETRTQFSVALEKIRSRDASIYDKSARFFTDIPSEASQEEATSDNHVPIYLKDVRAQQLLEFGAEVYSSDEEEAAIEEFDDLDNVRAKQERLMYDEEQVDNREMLLSAMPEESSTEVSDTENQFGGLTKVVKNDEDSKEILSPKDKASLQTAKQYLDAYFAHVTDLSSADASFLKQYIENEEWRVDKWGAKEASEDDVDLETDEAFLEQGEKFEADYNYRFEEPGSQQITGHPRAIDCTIRQNRSKRQRQRANKAERRKQQKLLEEQEIKEEKNKKKKEIRQKLQELNEACGGGVTDDLLKELLDSDNEFDVDNWDKEMERTFDDTYYNKEDAEFQPTANQRQPASGKDAVITTFEREEIDKDSDDISMDGQGMNQKLELKKLMRQYQELDREETIEDIKCRYRYIKVPKESYGLDSHEILCLTDKQLNEFVGLRRLNPYRDDPAAYHHNPMKLQKLLKEMDYTATASRIPTKNEETNTLDISNDNRHWSSDELRPGEQMSQEMDSSMKERLESYSKETLKPFQVQKQRKSASAKPNQAVQNNAIDALSSICAPSSNANDGLQGLSKATRKNIKRRKKRRSLKAQT